MTRAHDLPVAVIGGGPAGTAAAIELRRRGREAIVLERSRYEGVRIGESVPPPARQLIRELGLPETVLSRYGTPCEGIWSAWGSAEVFEKSFIFNPFGHGFHIDRCRLDASLAEEAEARGVEVLRGSKLVSCARDGQHWRVGFETPSGSDERPASFLIDASGRSSAVAAIRGAPRITFDRLIAVARHYKGRHLEPVTFVESAESGWWYSAPLPGGTLIVVYLTDADLQAPAGRDADARWMRLLAAAPHTSRRTDGMDLHPEAHTFMADTYRVARSEGWINAGAAAIGLDPLSSDGICFALRSGRDAARAADAHLAGDGGAAGAYVKSLEDYFAAYLAERSSFYAAERRWPDSPFWRRRVMEAASPASSARWRGSSPRSTSSADRAVHRSLW